MRRDGAAARAAPGQARQRHPGTAARAAASAALLALLLLLALCAPAGASGKVIELADDNFDTLTWTGAWFVDIYAPW